MGFRHHGHARCRSRGQRRPEFAGQVLRCARCAERRGGPRRYAPSKRIKLGDINGWIAPLSITSDGLAQLGFKPAGTERAAKLYAANDLPKICQALAKVIADAPARAAEKAAA